jgi:histidinol-phosphate aminotransferase
MSRQNEAARKYTMDEMKMRSSLFRLLFNLFLPGKNYPGEYSTDMFDKHKIIMRSNKYSDGQWARVSIGTIDEMKQFIQVIGDPKNNMAAR